MIGFILLGIISLILGIFIGIKINKWSTEINEKIEKNKLIKKSNEIFKLILFNILNNQTKFRNRINNTIFMNTTLPEFGKVELIYLLDKRDMAVFQENQCIFTSEYVDKTTLEEISKSINEKHQKRINDVVDIFGLIFSRKEFEKNFFMELEEYKNVFSKGKKETVKKITFNIDDILDKINREGIDNLTPEEKNFLDNYRG